MTDCFCFNIQLNSLLLFLVVAFISVNPSYAQQTDSVVSRSSLFVIPHAGYQQETSWSGGIAGGYYFKSKSMNRISSVSGSAEYTLLDQFLYNITPKIFIAEIKW